MSVYKLLLIVYVDVCTICVELINVLSPLAIVSLVVTGWLLSPPSLPNLTHLRRCQRLITICSVLEITRKSSVFYSCVFHFFPSFAAVSPGLWLQIVICSFASLMPHHMAPNNWKRKQWKLMLCLPRMLHQILLPLTQAATMTLFKKWMLGLYRSQAKPTPTSFFHFNQTSIRI